MGVEFDVVANETAEAKTAEAKTETADAAAETPAAETATPKAPTVEELMEKMLKLELESKQNILAKEKAEKALTLEKAQQAAKKREHMSAEEQAVEAQKEADAMKRDYELRMARLDIETTFTRGGLASEDYGDIIDLFVSEDRETALARAKAVTDLLAVREQKAAKRAKDELIKANPAFSGAGKDKEAEVDPFVEAFNSGFAR
jgi:hypothetical protein